MTLIKKGRNVLTALAIIFFVNVLATLFLMNVLDQPWQMIQSSVDSWQMIVYACIMAPVVEELIFRWAPNEFFRHFEHYNKFKWALAIMTSVIFGWLHGNYFNVWIQGTAGFMYSWLYIKNKFSYWSCVIAHSTWNFTLSVTFPLLSKIHPIQLF